MSFFGKKLIFKYKREVDHKTNKEIKYPVANIVLGQGECKFETTAIIDSGSDISFISEEVAELLNLKLGKSDDADVLGGGSIKVKLSEVKMVFVRGSNRIDLGVIPVCVGIGVRGKDSDMGILIGRNPIFDFFKITFEQSKNIVVFQRINPKWYKY